MNAVDIQSNDEIRDLYRELILDHSRNPRHFGKLPAATHTSEGINPLCGDKLRLYLQLNAEQKIIDISFEGSGCAISVASASLLSETVKGLHVKDALNIFSIVTAHLTTGNKEQTTAIDLGKIRALDGVREFPTRVKCATLAWHALSSALLNQAEPVSTE